MYSLFKRAKKESSSGGFSLYFSNEREGTARCAYPARLVHGLAWQCEISKVPAAPGPLLQPSPQLLTLALSAYLGSALG